jgi:transmembrane sensor
MKDETHVAQWLAGELSDTELTGIVGSKRFATLLRIRETFDHIQTPQLRDEHMLDTIFGYEKMTAPKVMPLYRSRWMQAVAALIVILFGLGVYFTSVEEVSAAYGQTYALTLPDQSQVMLNSGSQAAYKDFNWDSNRIIKLDGEAYFKVAKGKRFDVETPLGKVSVLGTQFNVKARGNRLDVTCYEGRVLVQYKAKQVVVNANQYITVESDATSGVQPVDVKEPQWMHDELFFNKEKFSSVIEEIERHYNVTIKTDYKTSQPLSGPIPGNNLDQALHALSVTFHLKVTRDGSIIILSPVHAAQ